ncbi:hypothetical protein [Erythrobacter longus]|nr:hypothetical protein [Erythrobacter longus]
MADTELPALSQLLLVMQPYLECRTPYDRQMIELETSLRGATYAPRPAVDGKTSVAEIDERLAAVNSDAREACNYLDLELQVFEMLPNGRGNRAYSARDLIRSAEELRRVQLTYEEDLFVWQIPIPGPVGPNKAEATHD